MQVQSTLLARSSSTSTQEIDSDQAQSQRYHCELEKWRAGWKQLITSFVGDVNHDLLEAFGELNYIHGVFLVSLMQPHSESYLTSSCKVMSQACLHLLRHQRLFAHPMSGDDPLILVFPVTWTVAHAVLQMILQWVQTETKTTQKFERELEFANFLSVLESLEACPENLMAGISVMLDQFRQDF
jgi:hypothetical protein